MAAKCASPAPPLGEKHIFENQTVKLGMLNASGEDIRRVLSALGVACGRRIYTKGDIAALKSGVKVF